MGHVQKRQKAQSAVRIFETTFGTPGKTAKNSGTATAGVTLFSFFWSPRGRPHFSPSSLSRFLCLQGRRRPLSGCHVSSSDTCRWHFPEIRVPKQDTLFNPKFMATRPKMKFCLRIHALSTSLILVLTSLNRLASLRVSLHFLHLWLPRWNSSTMKCLMFFKCFFKDWCR